MLCAIDTCVSCGACGGPLEPRTFRAPEVWQGFRPTVAADLWSWGCVAFWLFKGALSAGNAGRPTAVTRPELTAWGASSWDALVPRQLTCLSARKVAASCWETTSDPPRTQLGSKSFEHLLLDQGMCRQERSQGLGSGIQSQTSGMSCFLIP